MFLLLPTRKLYPDYYQIIGNPIDLKQIAMKIQANEYSNLNKMENDLDLLTKNAIYTLHLCLQLFITIKTNMVDATPIP